MNEIVYAIVGWIEVFIGIGALAYLSVVQLFNPAWAPEKSFGVFVFVAVTSFISFILGIGLLRHREWARIMLIFFAGYIMIEKGLIFSGLIHFNGEVVSGSVLAGKNITSFVYHCFVFIVLLIYKKRAVHM